MACSLRIIIKIRKLSFSGLHNSFLGREKKEKKVSVDNFEFEKFGHKMFITLELDCFVKIIYPSYVVIKQLNLFFLGFQNMCFVEIVETMIFKLTSKTLCSNQTLRTNLLHPIKSCN